MLRNTGLECKEIIVQKRSLNIGAQSLILNVVKIHLYSEPLEQL